MSLSFDDAATCTRGFAGLLQSLLSWSEDQEAYYMVLKPDPIWYFHKQFAKDAAGTNCYEWVNSTRFASMVCSLHEGCR